MTRKQQVFVQTVFDYYAQSGRGNLPWRKTHDPYCIMVSELMLQQTQVDRVIPKYEAFIETWPTVQSLAAAPLRDVLVAWQGLGYNRRAKYLHACADVIMDTHQGVFPDTLSSLEELPGIGPYTARAIMAFAYNVPVSLIETNVRTVYLHHFFPDQEGVSDTEILKLVEQTVPRTRAREWYAALMDYGTYLKKKHGNPNVRSRHYTKQSKFKGSDREVRGAVLRVLSQHDQLATSTLYKEVGPFEKGKVQTQVTALLREGLIKKVGRRLELG